MVKGVGVILPSVNGSYSNSEINSDYLSVWEQTGLHAGSGGFESPLFS